MEIQKLTYLDACIKEAFRMHPPPGFDMERVVPEGGATIAGEYVPGGTIVSCNAWVLHRNKNIFGEDVETFRPERWLESEEQSKAMNSIMFHFGAGAHTCVGKNIAILEMYKLIPAVLMTYDVSDMPIFLASATRMIQGERFWLMDILQLTLDSTEEWKFRSTMFVKPSNFRVRLTRRDTKTE
jgi:cytochrome P450